MKALLVVLSAAAMGLPSSPAAAFDDTPRNGPNFSCTGFQGGSRNADPELMQQLSGVWRATFPVQLAGFQPTNEQMTTTRHPQGSLLYDEVECLQPIAPVGSPTLEGRCVTATGHGFWYAVNTGDGEISLTQWQEGSGFGGNHVGPNCTTARVRFLDANTIESEYGVVGHRVGIAE